MMKHRKPHLYRLLFVVFTLVFFAPTLQLTQATSFPNPTPNLFVHDYTNTLTFEETTYLTSLGESLWQQTGVQAVIAIVPSTAPLPISDYANQLFRTWGIGTKAQDTGLLLLVALEDQNWRVEVGRGLEGALPDLLTANIMDTKARPHFQSGNMGTGIVNAYTAFAQTLATNFDVTLNLQPLPTAQTSRHTYPISIIAIILLALDLIFNRGRIFNTFFRLLLLRNLAGGSPSNRGGGGSSGGGLGGGGFGGGSSNGGGSSGSW